MKPTAYLLNFGVHHQVQVLVNGTSTVNVAMGTVGSAASIAIDPLQPVFCAVASNKILKIIRDWDALAVNGLEEVLLDGVGVVAKGDLDWALEAVDITVVARPLGKVKLDTDRLSGTLA